jgi:periplasmic protein CpxP/Spy
MSRLKLITYIAFGLLIINLTLIVFLILGNPKHPRHGGPKEIIIERLHFDAAQTEAYSKLITEHRSSITEKEQAVLKLKNRLYELLRVEVVHSEKMEIERELGELQIQIEDIHFKHFQNIKELCRPEQMKDYKILIQDIAELFSHPKPRK